MKHKLVELIEESIGRGIGIAIDLLEQFNRGDYDFGQDRMERQGVSSEEYNAVKMETENRLNGDVLRSEVVTDTLKNMEMDNNDLYSEKSFSALLSKKSKDGILVLDIEGMLGEMCRVVIPAIIQHGIESYAASCRQWLSACEHQNKQWFVDPDIMPILEKMEEAHALKMKFCSKSGEQVKNVMAL
jgi:hypothetical protein